MNEESTAFILIRGFVSATVISVICWYFAGWYWNMYDKLNKKFEFITWVKPSDCMDFKAWLHWKVFEGSKYGMFYRLIGFEWRVKR